MSTEGVLILRRDKAEKGMKISHDAYPASAGADIVDLIKTIDINTLYDLIRECDRWKHPQKITYTDSFSYDSCMHAVRMGKPLWVSRETKEDIKNSLFCEYAYVIDLDQESLFLYEGLQTKPMKNNPYGAVPAKNPYTNQAYYPCRPIAGFPLNYVRNADTDSITNAMKQALQEDSPGICYYMAGEIVHKSEEKHRWEEKLTRLKAGITNLIKRMCYIEGMLTIWLPISEKRYRELEQRYIEVNVAVKKLEEQIELIK